MSSETFPKLGSHWSCQLITWFKFIICFEKGNSHKWHAYHWYQTSKMDNFYTWCPYVIIFINELRLSCWLELLGCRFWSHLQRVVLLKYDLVLSKCLDCVGVFWNTRCWELSWLVYVAASSQTSIKHSMTGCTLRTAMKCLCICIWVGTVYIKMASLWKDG